MEMQAYRPSAIVLSKDHGKFHEVVWQHTIMGGKIFSNITANLLLHLTLAFW